MEPRFIRTHVHLNLHPVERWIRIIAGTILIIAAFAGDEISGFFILFGAIPFITGIMGFCPIYYALSFNTNRLGRSHKDLTLRDKLNSHPRSGG